MIIPKSSTCLLLLQSHWRLWLLYLLINVCIKFPNLCSAKPGQDVPTHAVIPAAFTFGDLLARKHSPGEQYHDTFMYTSRDVKYGQAFAAVWSNRGESLKCRL